MHHRYHIWSTNSNLRVMLLLNQASFKKPDSIFKVVKKLFNNQLLILLFELNVCAPCWCIIFNCEFLIDWSFIATSTNALQQQIMLSACIWAKHEISLRMSVFIQKFTVHTFQLMTASQNYSKWFTLWLILQSILCENRVENWLSKLLAVLRTSLKEQLALEIQRYEEELDRGQIKNEADDTEAHDGAEDSASLKNSGKTVEMIWTTSLWIRH